MLAIGCGYPDGNDFDWLRRNPAFKLACGCLPDSGRDLCRHPQSITPTRRLRSRSDYLPDALRAEQTSVFWEIALQIMHSDT
jgi:hypothetical protein